MGYFVSHTSRIHTHCKWLSKDVARWVSPPVVFRRTQISGVAHSSLTNSRDLVCTILSPALLRI